MGYNSFPVVRGRGMVKWNPFASIPEQYEEIHRMFEEQYKVPKPFFNTRYYGTNRKSVNAIFSRGRRNTYLILS